MGHIITSSTGAVLEKWDDTTRTYTDYRTTPATVRPYTTAENTAADAQAGCQGPRRERASGAHPLPSGSHP